MVDVKVNVDIWYDWLLLCLFCFLERVRRFLWDLIFIAISNIPIHYCYLDVSNSTTAVVCEDKLIWFIAAYIVDAGYGSVRHRDGAPTTSGDILCRVKNHKLE